MAVEREEVHGPFAVGGAVVTRIYRQANGQWFAEFDLNFRIGVGDGREVFVRKYVNVSASEQRGRKPSVVTQSTDALTLAQLRRIDQAARVYVEDRTHGNYSKLCDALFDGVKSLGGNSDDKQS